MEIILLQDVEKLGLKGDVVNVARGYARNYLLPRRLAEVATPARVTELRRVESQRTLQEARSAEQAQEIAEVLGKTVLRFEVKSGPTGSLFGSVTSSDIVDEIWRTRKVRVDRRKVSTDPIKRIGRFTIPIELFEDVHVEVKTLVVPEGGELPPEEELAAIEAAEAAEAAAAEAAARGRARRGGGGDRGGHRRGGARGGRAGGGGGGRAGVGRVGVGRGGVGRSGAGGGRARGGRGGRRRRRAARVGLRSTPRPQALSTGLCRSPKLPAASGLFRLENLRLVVDNAVRLRG